MLSRIFKAFQYRDFRLLWFGACTSSIGTWMQKLAESWVVLQLSNSPFLLGLDAFLGELPILLFSLIGGVAADRRDRRHLLIASQIVQMSCALLLALLFVFKIVKVWHILCLSFVTGLAQAFGGPAYQALIPSIVSLENVANAIALNSIQFNLARVIGPVLGGIALARLGPAWCFGLNGLSFCAVIVSLLIIRTPFIKGPQVSMLDSMKQGLWFVRRHAVMPALVVLAFLMTLLGIPLVVFLPVFARDVFHSGVNSYTVLLSTYGAGSIAGALLVAAMGNAKYKGRIALGFLVFLGVTMGAFAFSRTLIVGCVFLFLAGASLVGVFSLVGSLVQETTADAMRGRVMSVYNVAFRGGMPVGSLVTGAVTPVFGVPLVLAAEGALLSALGLYYLAVQRRVASL
ncbi:MAG TPA: MFS transporter [Bryobacteraceae bacterium]|nr:MFS transporter [Bryobacteraceae bacterium]